MMRATIAWVLPFFVLSACGDGKKEAAEEIAAAASSWSVDLQPYDLPLTVEIGDIATLGADTVLVEWNEGFGHTTVNAGDRFRLIIREEPGDLARLKDGLDRDMLRKNTVIDEGPERLVYRSQFPDENLVYVHFCMVVIVGDRSFVVQDDPNGHYNEMDIIRMAGAVKPAQPV